MSEHTPGPWTIEDNDVDTFSIVGDGRVIAEVDRQADADLIVCALEMRELLQLFTRKYEDQNFNHHDFRVMVKLRSEELITKTRDSAALAEADRPANK